MNYYIETYQDGRQLLGSDFTKIVRNCKTDRKLNNAIKAHKQHLQSLVSINPFLSNGYELKTVKF
jgi:hypothetical protein